MKRDGTPRRKRQAQEIRDNSAIVTDFFYRQSYITISTLHPDDNQALKALPLPL